MVLSDAAVEKVADLLEHPPAPSARLAAAVRRKR
jgi:uncharacterized protein (DUF1778 family)